MDRLHHIRTRLAPLKAALLAHPIYRCIDRLDSLHRFMEHHVFAVWDFMSLLKSLQRRLCCVDVPWLPAADPTATRLINEIVLAEESDADGKGGFTSHFELYRRAMIQSGANTGPIDRFVGELRRGQPVTTAIASPGIPEPARRFVQHTFRLIDGGDVCAIASAFTFGREDLLPAVFQRIVDESGATLQEFKYYLDRHIGLDGEDHGPMASRLLCSLCGSDECRWQVAEQAAVDCLEARRALWDGIIVAGNVT